MGAVAFDLLVGGDSAEDYFGELSGVERAICYAPDPVSAADEEDPYISLPDNFQRFLNDGH